MPNLGLLVSEGAIAGLVLAHLERGSEGRSSKSSLQRFFAAGRKGEKRMKRKGTLKEESGGVKRRKGGDLGGRGTASSSEDMALKKG